MVCAYMFDLPLNATLMQKERTLNAERTYPEWIIRELSGNDLNPAREARTDKIVENKNPPALRK